MKITVVTPTCDQPTGMKLAELFMSRQTASPDQWIVVDDGIEPATLTMEQEHIRRQREPGCLPAQSFCRNLLAAIPSIAGEMIVFWEHDDYYAPDHLETICRQLNGASLLAGDDLQRYYHVGERRWRTFNNRGASLCQTAMRSTALPRFETATKQCLAGSKIGVDFMLWSSTPDHERSLARANTVLGIKGLPGRPGLGVGHRPGKQWTRDDGLTQLRSWIGNDADLYAGFHEAK